MTNRPIADMPSPFPCEDQDAPIPDRPPIRRTSTHLDDWERAQLAEAFDKEAASHLNNEWATVPDRWATGRYVSPQQDPEPVPAYDPGDAAMRIVVTTWFVCALVAIGAGIVLHERSGPWVGGAFAVALATSAIGWAVAARAERKAARP